MPRGRQSAEPLWRAIAVFRFAGLGYAVLLTAVIHRAEYARLDWAWVVVGHLARLAAELVPREDYLPLLGHPAERIALPSRPRPARRLLGPD